MEKGVLQKIGPDQIKTLVDPLHIGVNQNSLKVFNMYPHGNDDSCSSADHLNFICYRFNAPQHAKQDTCVARIDYTVDSAAKHQLFLRGNLQNDHSGGTPQFPGLPANTATLANNKGIAVGWTGVLRPNIVNTVRYGLTRQGGETTGLLGSVFTSFRGFDTIYGTSTATKRIVPVHNVSEDFAWTKGTHDIRLGATTRFISNVSDRNGGSYHTATTNASGLAGSGAEMYQNLPTGFSAADNTSYTYAMDALNRRHQQRYRQVQLQDRWHRSTSRCDGASQFREQRVRVVRAGQLEDPAQLHRHGRDPLFADAAGP